MSHVLGYPDALRDFRSRDPSLGVVKVGASIRLSSIARTFTLALASQLASSVSMHASSTRKF